MFEFSDLNMQVMPQNLQQTQLCICLTNLQVSACRLAISQQCFCVSNQVTCVCLSHPVTFCRCLTNNITLCICLSKPIASVPPPFKDFGIYEQVKAIARDITELTDLEALRSELHQALKHVDIQHEVLQRTTG